MGSERRERQIETETKGSYIKVRSADQLVQQELHTSVAILSEEKLLILAFCFSAATKQMMGVPSRLLYSFLRVSTEKALGLHDLHACTEIMLRGLLLLD